MANFNESDFNLYNNTYIIMKEKESNDYNNETTNVLLANYKNFLDNYKSYIEDPEFLGNEEVYKRFRDNFINVYKTHGLTIDGKFAVPLYFYLFEQDPIGFNLEKFDEFVPQATTLSFGELLSVYDAYQPGMDLSEQQAVGSR